MKDFSNGNSNQSLESIHLADLEFVLENVEWLKLEPVSRNIDFNQSTDSFSLKLKQFQKTATSENSTSALAGMRNALEDRIKSLDVIKADFEELKDFKSQDVCKQYQDLSHEFIKKIEEFME